MSKLMISVAGIRGIIGDSVKPEEFVRFTLAFAEGCRPRRVVVGGDSRPSRHMVRHLVFGALEAAGCEVIDLGVCPTPTIGLMTRHLKAGGGVAITASHNPIQWNALKFFRADGTFLNAADNQALMARFEAGDFRLAPVQKLGAVQSWEKPLEEHLRRVLAYVDRPAIRRAKIRVAIDCCNGAGSVALPKLLDELGCQADVMFNDMDAPFPRGAEPMPKNLTALSERVRASGARIGFALDPDADRLALVDETGRPIGEERTVTLVANHLLRRFKSSVTVNLSTTRAVEDVCRAHGVACHRTPIGEAHVVGAMKQRRGRIGGEGNGGVILPDIHAGRDAMGGVAVLLEALAGARCALSEINAAVPDYVMIKDKVPIGGLAVEALYQAVGEAFGDGADVNMEDGLRIDLGDRWFHLRPSGTEPIFRVFVEAPDKGAAQRLLRQLRDVMSEGAA